MEELDRTNWLRTQSDMSKPGEGSSFYGYLFIYFSVRRENCSGTQITRDCLGPGIMATIPSAL